MKITTNVEATEFTKELKFYGETYADKKVVERINELNMFLCDVLFEIQKLEWSVEGQDEASAKEIDRVIKELKSEVTNYAGVYVNE